MKVGEFGAWNVAPIMLHFHTPEEKKVISNRVNIWWEGVHHYIAVLDIYCNFF